jgi:peptidoglycan/LPS O-acetylase OafA/YrhL
LKRGGANRRRTKLKSEEQMIVPGGYSESDKAAHVIDNVPLVIFAGIAAAMVVYAMMRRKFFSAGIPLIVSAVVVLADYLIKKLNLRLYIDLFVLMFGLCVCWLERKIRKDADS